MITPVTDSRGDLFPSHRGIPSAHRLAGIMAIFYLVTAGAYILISSSLAGEQAASVEDLERVEILKGMVFVVVTAAVMFGFNYLLLNRIRRHEDQIARQQHALHRSEAAVLAGVVATTIAHDINNALTVAVMSLDDLKADLVPGSRAAALVDDTATAMEEIGSWSLRLFDLGGQRAGREISTFDLVPNVRVALDLMRRHPRVQSTTLGFHPEDQSILFRGHASIVQRAVVNLVINAGEAVGAGGRIDVRLRTDQGRVVLEVHDNGPGVPVDQREQILKTFHTTKPDGTGLGLSSVVACAELHKGALAISDSPLGGACFVLTLQEEPGKNAVTLDGNP